MSEDEELLTRSLQITELPQYYIYKEIQSKFQQYGEIDFVKYGKNEAIIVFKSEKSLKEALEVKEFKIGESIAAVSQAQKLKINEDDYEFITGEKCSFDEDEKNQEKGQLEEIEGNTEEKQSEIIQGNKIKQQSKEEKYLKMIFNFDYFLVVLLAWTLYTVFVNK